MDVVDDIDHVGDVSGVGNVDVVDGVDAADDVDGVGDVSDVGDVDNVGDMGDTENGIDDVEYYVGKVKNMMLELKLATMLQFFGNHLSQELSGMNN